MFKKRAIILAGGKGTRLKPYTISLPKPLVPIDDKPVLEIIIGSLITNGFDHITITLGHLGEVIKAFFGDGSKWGITIDYSFEDKPLSTMGPLKIIKDLPDNFLIMNGDVLTELDYNKFYEDHVKKNNLFTVSTANRKSVIDYGVLEYNHSKTLTAFIEKPSYNYEVSMGIYMANKKICNYIPDNKAFGFDELMIKLLEEEIKVSVHPYDGFWLDIGRPDEYEKAIDYYKRKEIL
ncbi:MAG: NTP transferase domain-containing protein [Bacteroidetes bacterium]|jgi:NDP-mannose synthase|nr:NTP transferase domain-containing protein [Bacteroidota bacterium]